MNAKPIANPSFHRTLRDEAAQAGDLHVECPLQTVANFRLGSRLCENPSAVYSKRRVVR